MAHTSDGRRRDAMSGLRRRALLVVAVTAVLATAAAPTASAATIRRTWTATVSGATAGGGTASGSGVLVRYWAGTGSFSAQLQGLRPIGDVRAVGLPGHLFEADAPAAASQPGNRRGREGLGVRHDHAGPHDAGLERVGERLDRPAPPVGADVHCATLDATRSRPGLPCRAWASTCRWSYQPGNAFPWCNVAMYLPGLSAARRGGRHVPLRARPDRHVPSLCSPPRSSTTAPACWA